MFLSFPIDFSYFLKIFKLGLNEMNLHNSSNTHLELRLGNDFSSENCHTPLSNHPISICPAVLFGSSFTNIYFIFEGWHYCFASDFFVTNTDRHDSSRKRLTWQCKCFTSCESCNRMRLQLIVKEEMHMWSVQLTEHRNRY